MTWSPGASFSQTGPSPRRRTRNGGRSSSSWPRVTQWAASLPRGRASVASTVAGRVARQSPFSTAEPPTSAHGRAAWKSRASESLPGSSANSTIAAGTITDPTTAGITMPLRPAEAGGGEGAAEAEGEAEARSGVTGAFSPLPNR